MARVKPGSDTEHIHVAVCIFTCTVNKIHTKLRLYDTVKNQQLHMQVKQKMKRKLNNNY
jgi:hypothetical protein